MSTAPYNSGPYPIPWSKRVKVERDKSVRTRERETIKKLEEKRVERVEN